MKPDIEKVIYAFIVYSSECSSMPAYSPDVHNQRKEIRHKALCNLRDRLSDMGLGDAIDFSSIEKDATKEDDKPYSVYSYIQRKDLIRFLKSEGYNAKTLKCIEEDARKFSGYTQEALVKQAKKCKLAPHALTGWEAAKIAVYKHAKIRI